MQRIRKSWLDWDLGGVREEEGSQFEFPRQDSLVIVLFEKKKKGNELLLVLHSKYIKN